MLKRLLLTPPTVMQWILCPGSPVGPPFHFLFWFPPFEFVDWIDRRIDDLGHCVGLGSSCVG